MADYPRSEAVHEKLTSLGVPRHKSDCVYDRCYRVLDRLTLLPVGEPDTADLVGRINEICDRAGIAEGEAVWRVEVLAGQVGYLAHDKANLEAELAQLDAKPARLDVLPPPAFIESLRNLGVVGDVTVRVTH